MATYSMKCVTSPDLKLWVSILAVPRNQRRIRKYRGIKM